MTLTLDIDTPAFAQSIGEIISAVKVPCQAAMASTFATIVHHNFGDDGEDRPVAWEPLKPGYAHRYHGGDTTPKEVLTGELQASIEIDEASDDAASVSTNCPHARFQHEGGVAELNGHEYTIPPRPVFPILGNEVTPYTAQKCLDACAAQLERSLA